MTYAIPRNYVRPTRDFPARRRSARHRPKRTNPARPIANIFVPMGNIGGQGRGGRARGAGWAAARAHRRKGVEELERKEGTGTHRDGHTARQRRDKGQLCRGGRRLRWSAGDGATIHM